MKKINNTRQKLRRIINLNTKVTALLIIVGFLVIGMVGAFLFSNLPKQKPVSTTVSTGKSSTFDISIR